MVSVGCAIPLFFCSAFLSEVARQLADIAAHAAAHYDHFGTSVAFSGNDLFVGAPHSGDLDQVSVIYG